MPHALNLDPELSAKADRLFRELGLDLSTAVHLFLRQSIRENGLPFTPRLVPAPAQAAQGTAEARASEALARTDGTPPAEEASPGNAFGAAAAPAREPAPGSFHDADALEQLWGGLASQLAEPPFPEEPAGRAPAGLPGEGTAEDARRDAPGEPLHAMAEARAPEPEAPAEDEACEARTEAGRDGAHGETDAHARQDPPENYGGCDAPEAGGADVFPDENGESAPAGSAHPAREERSSFSDQQTDELRQAFLKARLLGTPLRRVRSLNRLYTIGEANPHVPGWREVYVSGDEPFALDFGAVRVELSYHNGGSLRMMNGRLPDDVLEADAVFPRDLSAVFSSVIGQPLTDVTSARIRRGDEESEHIRLHFANGCVLCFAPGSEWGALWLMDARGTILYAPDTVWRRLLGDRAWLSLR